MVKLASHHIIEQFMIMRAIISAITKSKPIKTQDLGAILSPIIKDLDMKIGKKLRGLDLKNHCKALIDGLQLMQLTIIDDPIDHGKEFLAQIDFFGNKILTSNNQEDIEWYKAYKMGMCIKFNNYISEAYESGMPFKLDGGDFKTNFDNELKAGEPTPAEEKKVETKEPTEKKVDTKKPVEEKKEVKAAAPAKRKMNPEKVLRGKMWDICYYENETLEFKEEDVKNDLSFMVTGCTKTNIIIHGKFNAITLTKCKGCALVVDSVIASISMIKCEDVNIQVNTKCQQLILDD